MQCQLCTVIVPEFDILGLMYIRSVFSCAARWNLASSGSFSSPMIIGLVQY